MNSFSFLVAEKQSQTTYNNSQSYSLFVARHLTFYLIRSLFVSPSLLLVLCVWIFLLGIFKGFGGSIFGASEFYEFLLLASLGFSFLFEKIIGLKCANCRLFRQSLLFRTPFVVCVCYKFAELIQIEARKLGITWVLQIGF